MIVMMMMMMMVTMMLNRSITTEEATSCHSPALLSQLASTQQLDTEQLQLDTEQLRALDHGNKLAVLGGDLLLAAACSRLAALRTPRVLELVSVAIAEMAQVT